MGDAAGPFASVHDRMACVLRPGDYRHWLDAGMNEDSARLKGLLKPYTPPGLIAYRIGALVNSPNDDTPGLVQPIDDEIIA